MQSQEMLMKRIAIECRDTRAGKEDVHRIVSEVVNPLFERIHTWFPVPDKNKKFKMDDVKKDIEVCLGLGKHKVAFEYSGDPQSNIKALVDVLTSCAKPLFKVVEAHAEINN